MSYTAQLNEEFKDLSLQESFETLLKMNFESIVFSTSFGQEDQVLTDIIFKRKYPIKIITLDTGRLFQATYKVHEEVINKYNNSIVTYFPNQNEIEKLINQKGPNSFYASTENRKECCLIRKVKPLQRALKGADLWITGLRKEQSQRRQSVNLFEYDDAFGLIKFNPLANWKLNEIEEYLNKNEVPQNELHKQGYLSIGCEPCTRALKPGENIREGRWWWEQSKKECGLHLN